MDPLENFWGQLMERLFGVNQISFWEAKDYFNGLDVGLYLAGPAADCLRAFTKGDAYKLWSLLPAEARQRQIQSIKKKVEESEYRRDNWISEYSQAKGYILYMQQAILALNLNPKKVLRAFSPPHEEHNDAFDAFAAELANKATRESAWLQIHPRNNFWIWSLSKYYRHCDENGMLFLACLDSNRTNQFCRLASRDFVDVGLPIFAFSHLLESKILTGMTLRDISNIMAVCKNWRMGMWAHLFLNPPTRYELPLKTPVLTWLCAIRRNNFILPSDIRKMIASKAQTTFKDTVIIWE